MSGIFVDPKKTFPVKVYYRSILDASGNEVSVDVLSEADGPPAGDGWRSMTCNFRQVAHGSFGSILEDSTIINHVNQKPTLRTKMLREQVLFKYMVSWDVGPDGEGGCEDEEKITPVDFNLLVNTHWHIANRIFIDYMVKVKMMDVVAKSIEEEDISRPLLSAAVWPVNPGEMPQMPNFPPMEGFGPIPGFDPSSM